MSNSSNPHPLDALGWSERVATLFDSLAESHSHGLPARVVRAERSASVVVDITGVERLIHTAVPATVGDWVVAGPDSVLEVLPRWSALTRASPDGPAQVLAANVDLVVVAAPADRLSSARVERELTLAWGSGARPLVAVTKADLAPPGLIDQLAGRLLGVDVLAVSATTGQGLSSLMAALCPDLTAVLLGPSGAGKSTLVNVLVGAEVQATGAVRSGDSRGRHTTSSRQLLAVPGGGALIDTPGVRSLGLIGDSDVQRAFPEIDDLAAECRFSDCSHASEPGCAVAAAITAGQLDPGRLASYRKLARELAHERRRQDPVARQAEQRVWKQRSKAARSSRPRPR